MCNPNRINEICDLLKEVWKQYPNKRLGELIADSIHTPICCYVSDEVLEEHLKQSLAWAKVLNEDKNRKERLTECGQERDSMGVLTMTEAKGCEYIVHFTEYSTIYPEVEIYKDKE